MKKSELQKLYLKLQSEVKNFTAQRDRVVRKFIFAILTPGIVLAFIIWNAFDVSFSDDPGLYFKVWAVSSTLSFIAALYLIWRPFASAYKKNIVEKIFSHYLQDCSFAPRSFISEHEMLRSRLLKARYSKYGGEDYVKGFMDGRPVEFSEILMERTSGHGKNRKRVIVFKGLFFKVQSDKSFPTTLLATYRNSGMLGLMLRQQGNHDGLERVQVESPDFSRSFNLYANDQVAVRRILTPAIMDKIINFNKKYKRAISFSCIGNTLYFSFRCHKNYFEPALWGPLMKWREFQEICEVMEFLRQFVSIKKDRKDLSLSVA